MRIRGLNKIANCEQNFIKLNQHEALSLSCIKRWDSPATPCNATFNEYVRPMPPWYIYCPPPHPRCTPTPPILHTPAGPLRGKQPPFAPLYHSLVYNTLVCHLVRHVAMLLRMKTGFGQTYLYCQLSFNPVKVSPLSICIGTEDLCKFS